MCSYVATSHFKFFSFKEMARRIPGPAGADSHFQRNEGQHTSENDISMVAVTNLCRLVLFNIYFKLYQPSMNLNSLLSSLALSNEGEIYIFL